MPTEHEKRIKMIKMREKLKGWAGTLICLIIVIVLPFIIWKFVPWHEPYPGYSVLDDPSQRWWVVPLEVVALVFWGITVVGVVVSLFKVFFGLLGLRGIIWAMLFGLCLIAAGWFYYDFVGTAYTLEGWVAIAMCFLAASKCWNRVKECYRIWNGTAK